MKRSRQMGVTNHPPSQERKPIGRGTFTVFCVEVGNNYRWRSSGIFNRAKTGTLWARFTGRDSTP